jgi:hypothetical protein
VQNALNGIDRQRKSDLTNIPYFILHDESGFDNLHKLNEENRFRWLGMGCWKWFDVVLKEAGVKVTDKNKDKVDKVIHRYVGEQSSYGRCSTSWSKARKEIQGNETMKKELIEKLRAVI